MSAEEVTAGLRQAEAKGEVIYISDDSDQDPIKIRVCGLSGCESGGASGHVTQRDGTHCPTMGHGAEEASPRDSRDSREDS